MMIYNNKRVTESKNMNMALLLLLPLFIALFIIAWRNVTPNFLNIDHFLPVHIMSLSENTNIEREAVLIQVNLYKQMREQDFWIHLK